MGAYSIRKSAKAALAALELLPPIRALGRLDYERRQFPRWANGYRGVYSSFEEARRTIRFKTGYDQPGAADLYDQRMEHAYPSDYPAMFWLLRLRGSYSSVFDFGGHIGISYYLYSKHVPFPPGLRWTVCDVPLVIERGRALSAERGATALSFTTDPREADGCDLFLSAGALQYVETPTLSQMLGALRRQPRHLILNKLPLWDGEPFVTIQNTIISHNPYQVMNRARLLESLRPLGYRLVESWDNPDVRCTIPYHPEHSLQSYTGMYLERPAT